MLYLDNAATTPVRPEVLEAMWPYLTSTFGNPSSHHTVGEAAAGALRDARRRVATVLGVRPGDVVFTSGGTEADNLAVKGITLAALERGRHVVTSPIEHEAVAESVAYLTRFHGVEATILPVDGTGLVDPAELAAALRPDTVLVSVMAANNEIGTVQDLSALGAVTRAAGVPFHTDAVQAAGWLPLGLDRLGVDALSLAGHKLGAPKGVGLLAVRGSLPLEPLLHGGGQERGRRSGTEQVAAAVGLATALELAERDRVEAVDRVSGLRDEFIARVLNEVPRARLTGHPERRLPGIASFVFPWTSGEAVLLELERRGVVSSSGSACAAGSDEPSPVLLAIGIAPEVAQTAVRFSWTAAVTAADLDRTASAVVASVEAVAGLR
ncbi:cysteine desulfurase family protein [Plantibacter sp. MMLR14_011]|uniref:cysteine desulfurase family protein n=1 Tax=Plantibacter sp. MMLR14_011 TaxID=1898746 RepID=UPI0008DDB4BC|nr:cysteine desulfurase family protein [Plantibacter sp. MMLR14_011]OII41100.1 cysteine desulfurase [Plantibacter sp. MMLR14_011]